MVSAISNRLTELQFPTPEQVIQEIEPCLGIDRERDQISLSELHKVIRLAADKFPEIRDEALREKERISKTFMTEQALCEVDCDFKEGTARLEIPTKYRLGKGRKIVKESVLFPIGGGPVDRLIDLSDSAKNHIQYLKLNLPHLLQRFESSDIGKQLDPKLIRKVKLGIENWIGEMNELNLRMIERGQGTLKGGLERYCYQQQSCFVALNCDGSIYILSSKPERQGGSKACFDGWDLTAAKPVKGLLCYGKSSLSTDDDPDLLPELKKLNILSCSEIEKEYLLMKRFGKALGQYHYLYVVIDCSYDQKNEPFFNSTINRKDGEIYILFVPPYETDLELFLSKGESTLSTEQIHDIFSQLLESSAWLEKNAYSHHDFKPANILFKPKTTKVAVTDWGFSAPYSERGAYRGTDKFFPPEYEASWQSKDKSVTYRKAREEFLEAEHQYQVTLKAYSEVDQKMKEMNNSIRVFEKANAPNKSPLRSELSTIKRDGENVRHQLGLIIDLRNDALIKYKQLTREKPDLLGPAFDAWTLGYVLQEVLKKWRATGGKDQAMDKTTVYDRIVEGLLQKDPLERFTPMQAYDWSLFQTKPPSQSKQLKREESKEL